MKFRMVIWLMLSILFVSVPALVAQGTPECEDGFRLFEHTAGNTCIPEDPQRIVTLSDQNALLPLLELGVQPIGSAGRLLDDGTTMFRRVNEYDTEGIVGVGDFLAPNLEAILALEPDLIVGYELFNIEAYDDLSQIAPTVLIQVFNRPLNEALMDFAAVVGKADVAEELETAYKDRVQTLLDELGERADILTISVITTGGTAGEFYNAASGQALGTVMDALGFNRPAPEQAGGDDVGPWSVETLNVHDADVMLIVDFSGELSDPVVEEFITSPLFGTLAVAQADQVYIIDGIQTVGAAWGKMNVFLDELEFILLDADLDVDVVGEPVADSTAECADGSRPFVHVTGEAVCVPETPQRIVAIHDINAGAQILSLGGPLVGMASREDGFRDDVTRYFDVEGITDIGNVYEPNLERILALQPDLIVHEGFGDTFFLIDDEMLATLQAIAPVVAIDAFRPVEEVMADYQELLGDAATVSLEEQQATFAERLAEIESILGDDWQQVTASFVDVATDGTLQIWGPTALVPLDILTRVGVTWVPIQQEAGLEENDGFLGGISLERIDTLNADLSLVDVRFMPQTLDNPLYQQLVAVQAGQVVVLDEPFSGTHYPNYIATAEMLLDGLTALDAINTGLIEEPEQAQPQAADFPVTIDHKFGSTTLTQAPERVVVLGFTEQDPYLALGVAPVAIRYWYGDTTDAIFPWADDEAGDADPVILNMPFGTLNYEAILALEPDLISAVDAGITREEYETLSQIAPTLAQYDTYVDFGMPWQETTRLIGRALGKTAQAEALIADLEAQLVAVRQTYPEFEGKSIVVAYNAGGTYGYYTAQDSRGRFFTDLGFVIPDELNDIAGDSFYADISTERLDLLDRDLIVFLALQFYEDGSEAAREAIASDPLLSRLEAVQDERVLFVADEYDDALQFSTILSVQYLLENLVPEIAATLGLSVADAMTTTDTMCADGLRLFDHEALATDPVCIPAVPQRIIALDQGIMANLIALDVSPAGVHDWGNRDFAPYVDSDAVASVGTPEGPNLEAILALNPDLIISKASNIAWYGDDTLENLQAIAPVVLSNTDNTTWEEEFLLTGAVINQEQEAQRLLGLYEQRLQEFRNSVNTDDITIAIIRSRADAFNIYVGNYFIVDVVQAAGLQFPPAFADLPSPNSISLEELEMLDSDYLFVMVRNDNEGAYFQRAVEGPLWGFLPAVQQEQVYTVDWSTWVSGWNIVGAHLVVDDLFRYFADTISPTPNPFTTDETTQATAIIKEAMRS